MSTLQLAEHIARCLDEDKLDYAVGGALALTVQRRVRVVLPDGHEMWFISAEDLCITKLFFGRAKDIADLERVFAAHPDLDVAYVRGWLLEMVPAGDRRLALLDDLQARFS